MKTVRLMKQLVGVERREIVEGEVELLECLVKSDESVVVNGGQLIVRRVETHQTYEAVAVYGLQTIERDVEC